MAQKDAARIGFAFAIFGTLLFSLKSIFIKLLYAEGLDDIINATHPDVVSIEGAFYCKNVKTAMVLGEARGVAIAACARHGLAIYEYAPRRVKQALVGYGRAEKDQVAKMVKMLLGLEEQPQSDAADALAIAICHIHNMRNITAVQSV